MIMGLKWNTGENLVEFLGFGSKQGYLIIMEQFLVVCQDILLMRTIQILT